MLYILYLLYAVILCYFFWRTLRSYELGKTMVGLILLAKCLACFAMAYIPLHLMQGMSDYNHYFNLGLTEQDILLTKPSLYFSDFGQNNNEQLGALFSAEHSFWDDLAGNVIVKILALLNFPGGRNFYLVTLLFGFTGLIGSIYFFKYFLEMYPRHKKAIAIGSFLLPSVLIFTSGIHKDSLIFICIGALLYYGNLILKKPVKTKAVIIFALYFLLLFSLRNYVAVLFLAAYGTVCVWKLAKIRYKYLLPSLAIIALLFVSLLTAISPAHSPYRIIMERQNSFAKLSIAKTQVQIPELEPTTLSFTKAIPRVVDNVAFRPYPWQYYSSSLSLIAIEGYLYLLLLALAIFIFFKKNYQAPSPLLLWPIVFAMLAFLIIGYITTNSGTIVRYRALFLPIIITPALIILVKRLHISKNNI